MDLQLGGAVAVITGGGAGIGRAAAHALADEGARISILDRDPAAAATTVQQLQDRGFGGTSHTVDVAVEDSVQNGINQVAQTHGRIDILICCAGLSGLYGTAVDDVTVDQWDRLMAVNLRGQWLPVKHALPHLRRSDQAAIVIMASDSALVAAPLHTPYCASKGGVLMLTKALAVDLRPDKVRVNCVCPSVVDTGMSRTDLDLTDAGFDSVTYPVQQPEDIARYITFLASPAAATINGHALVADYGYSGESSFPA